MVSKLGSLFSRKKTANIGSPTKGQANSASNGDSLLKTPQIIFQNHGEIHEANSYVHSSKRTIVNDASLHSISLLDDKKNTAEEQQVIPLKTKRKADFVNNTVKKVLTGIKKLTLARKPSPPPSQSCVNPCTQYMDNSISQSILVQTNQPLVLINSQLHSPSEQLLFNSKNCQQIYWEIGQLDQQTRQQLIKDHSMLVDRIFEKSLQKIGALEKIEMSSEYILNSCQALFTFDTLATLRQLHGLLTVQNELDKQVVSNDMESKYGDSLLNLPVGTEKQNGDKGASIDQQGAETTWSADNCRIVPITRDRASIGTIINPVPVLPLRKDSEVFQQHRLAQMYSSATSLQELSMSKLLNAPIIANPPISNEKDLPSGTIGTERLKRPSIADQSTVEFSMNRVYLEHYKLSHENVQDTAMDNQSTQFEPDWQSNAPIQWINNEYIGTSDEEKEAAGQSAQEMVENSSDETVVDVTVVPRDPNTMLAAPVASDESTDLENTLGVVLAENLGEVLGGGLVNFLTDDTLTAALEDESELTENDSILITLFDSGIETGNTSTEQVASLFSATDETIKGTIDSQALVSELIDLFERKTSVFGIKEKIEEEQS